MALRKEGLDKKIMLSAKKEFLIYGFKDASTNRIAQDAGVTSGAVYVRYKNKDEIFSSLVQPIISGMKEKIQFYNGSFSALGEDKAWDKINALDEEIFDWLIDYIFSHYEEFRLLICKSDGSSVSGFVSEFIDFKFQKIYGFLENKVLPVAMSREIKLPISKEEIALLCSAEYHNLFETIRQGYEKAEAKKYLSTVRKIYTNGLQLLLKDFIEEMNHTN